MTNDTIQISEREREILRLVATGATNQQIAYQLNISVNTVKVHLRNIFGKIGVASRTEATLYAVRSGLVQVSEVPPGPGAAAALAEEPPIAADLPVLPDLDRSEREAAAHVGDLADAPGEPEAVEPPAVPARRGRRILLFGAALLALIAVGVGVWLALGSGATPAVQPESTSASVVLPGQDQRWRDLAPLPAGRAGFALASYGYEGAQYLYVIGGQSEGAASDQVLRFDSAGKAWVAFSAKPTAVSDVQAAVIGSRIYVPGGRAKSGEVLDVFEAYEPQRDRWVTLAKLPQARSGYALATVEGKLYLFGGWDGKAYRDEVWQYNPDGDTWVERAKLPTPRAYAAAAAIDGQIYVVGGEDGTGPLSVNERYTPSNESDGSPWATAVPLPAKASHIAATASNGWLFVIGGSDSAGRLLVARPGSGGWDVRATPLASLADLRAQAVNDRLYIVGGSNAGALSAQAYEYQAIYSIFLPLNPQSPNSRP